MPHILKKKHVSTLVLFLFLIAFYFVLYKMYIPRVNAFGCFDDCFNFMGGFFILEGKKIFTDFFYNHQPGMAYLSALTQYVFNPQNIPELILRHRQVMMLLSFAMGTFIFWRFGKIFLVSIVIYELTKFYVFGDRFLAEGLVVYLLIYQMGVVWQTLFYKKTNKIDLFVMPLFSWAIIFLREPFVPATLALFALYLFALRKNKLRVLKVFGLFAFTSLFSFFHINIFDYIYNVFTLNRVQFGHELSEQGQFYNFLTSLFYPFYLILSPEDWTPFRAFLAINSGLFITSLVYLLVKIKKVKEVVFVIMVLTLSNLRPVVADRSFYEAFHIIPWYGLLIFSIVFLAHNMYQFSKKIGVFLFVVLICNLFLFISNKQYFAYEKVNPNDEYFVHFSHVMGAGTVIRNLSNPNDTLFVDGLDELVIWEAKRHSPYVFSWYTSFMPSIQKYNDARTDMFRSQPPDFYYGKCMIEHAKNSSETSEILLKNYIQLKSSSNKTCILIHKEKVTKITEDQKLKLNGYDYYF